MFHYFDNVIGALAGALVDAGDREAGRYYWAVVEDYWRVVFEEVVVDSYFYIGYFHNCCCSFELQSCSMMMMEAVFAVVVGVVVVHSYHNVAVVVAVAIAVVGVPGSDIGMRHVAVVNSYYNLEDYVEVDVQGVEGAAVYNSHHNVVEGVKIDFVLHPSVVEVETEVVDHFVDLVVLGCVDFGYNWVVVVVDVGFVR